MPSFTERARISLKHAMRVRRAEKIELELPLSAIDLADRRGVEVWFQDVPSMEGLYLKSKMPRILLPADRPMGRQSFGCAHELGHHEFGHGTKVDQQEEMMSGVKGKDEEEELANMFAGYLLMPQMAVQQAFVIRAWSFESPTPLQAYTVSCALGVSYAGLLTHMSRALKLLSNDQADRLSRIRIPQIREMILGCQCPTRLIPVDVHWKGIPIDLWVGDKALLPHGSQVEDSRILSVMPYRDGELLESVRPGITRVRCDGWSSFVRVCRARYSGRSKFRFLEDPDAD